MAGEFGPDGTQALAPVPLFTDPVAGLVTGESFVYLDSPVAWSAQVVVPPAVDSAEVQAAIKAALVQEDRRRQRLRQSNPPRHHPLPIPAAPIPAAQGLGPLAIVAVLLVGALILGVVVVNLLH